MDRGYTHRNGSKIFTRFGLISRLKSCKEHAGYIDAAVPDCLVRNYRGIAKGLELPDENDRHVLAAAIKAGAQVIVTCNLRDFPAETSPRI